MNPVQRLLENVCKHLPIIMDLAALSCALGYKTVESCKIHYFKRLENTIA